MTDLPSPSSSSQILSPASSQNLKVTPELKTWTIPASAIATAMALSFKLLQVNILGSETYKVCKTFTNWSKIKETLPCRIFFWMYSKYQTPVKTRTYSYDIPDMPVGHRITFNTKWAIWHNSKLGKTGSFSSNILTPRTKCAITGNYIKRNNTINVFITYRIWERCHAGPTKDNTGYQQCLTNIHWKSPYRTLGIHQQYSSRHAITTGHCHTLAKPSG